MGLLYLSINVAETIVPKYYYHMSEMIITMTQYLNKYLLKYTL